MSRLHFRFSSFIALTILIIVAAPQFARAAAASSPSPACGTTVEQNLAAARQALQTRGAGTPAALACLIQATGTLNDKLRSEESGQAQSSMMHMPVLNVPVKPGGQ